MTPRFRALGVLPALFFLAHHLYHWHDGRPADSLWMCHVSNLTLAAGLLFGFPELVRMAVLWLVPGIPLWISDLVETGDAPPTTFLAHFGGVTVGLAALRRVGLERRSWLFALAWYLVWQQVCRMWTPPELNVNIAHRMRDGWEVVFGSYWQYWLGSTMLAAGVLWSEGLALRWVFPASGQPRS